MKSIRTIIFEHTIAALRFYAGDRSKVVKALGISDRTLRNYIREIRTIPELNEVLLTVTRKHKIVSGEPTKCYIFPTNEERVKYMDNYPNRYSANE